ncbi:MAG: amidohydrolase family protein, partial [Pseudomonadota bacterium]
SDGAVVISKTEIVAVGSREQIDQQYIAPKSVPGKGRVLLPGLVNGHTHTSMTLFRGMVDDLDLMTWLNNYVFPMEGRFVTPDFVRAGTTLACWEMIRGGTTTFVDMYFYPDEIAGVVERCGLRAVVAAPHIDYPSPGFKGWDDSFAAARDFVGRWQGKHPRITPAFAPHAPYTVSPEHLKATVEAAASSGSLISMHLAEAPAESAYIEENFSTTPVQHVAGLGMYDQQLIAAHMVQLSPADIALTAKSGVGAIHNPTSNMKLGAGISPVPAMLAAGVNVGLGTDGAASNNDLDMWEEVRMAALLHKVKAGDPTALPATTALAMATRIGAAAIRHGDRIGQLKPGMQADMIQVDFSATGRQPVYDITSHLVYTLDANDVVTTIVAGQLLMNEREVLTIDESTLRKDVAAASARVRDALDAQASSP